LLLGNVGVAFIERHLSLLTLFIIFYHKKAMYQRKSKTENLLWLLKPFSLGSLTVVETLSSFTQYCGPDLKVLRPVGLDPP
jgi:hypothetical protein